MYVRTEATNANDYSATYVGELLQVVGGLALQASIENGDAVLSRTACAMKIAGREFVGRDQIDQASDVQNLIWKSLNRLSMWPGNQSLNTKLILSLLQPTDQTKDKKAKYDREIAVNVIKKNLLACGIDFKKHHSRNVEEKHFLRQFTEELEALAKLDTETMKKRKRQTPIDYPAPVNAYLKMKEKTARFAVEHLPDNTVSSPLPNPPAWRKNCKKVHEFCGMVVENIGPAHKCLFLEGSNLFLLKDTDEADSFLKAEASVSLDTVLRQGRLTSKMKLILAYILAQSVWRYYGSDWMSIRWSSEFIHFMKEETSIVPKVQACKPCLVLQFDESETDKISEYYDRQCVHPYPRILSLGNLLVDIARDPDSMPNKQGKLPNKSVQINTDYMLASLAFKDEKWPYLGSLRTVRDPYKALTKSCFDKNLFESGTTQGNPDASRKGMQEIDEVKTRRAIIYDKIVFPLEELVNGLGWQKDLQRLESIIIEDVSDQVRNWGIQTPDAQPRSISANESKFNRSDAVFLASSSEQTLQVGATQWLTRLQLAYQTFTRSNPSHTTSETSQRIKIAVLDTGYDPKSDFFLDRDRKKCLLRGAWKDFVQAKERPIDAKGHGTMVLSLLMKVAPLADIYVARIAERNKDLENAGEAIKEAIKWAAITCSVDIISMSFGFPPTNSHSQAVISNTIDEVCIQRENKLLFFAAAGNEGANQQLVFPAKHKAVIPIYGTNAQGEFQRSMNPPLLRDGPSIFGTLAVEVPCAGLRDQGEVFESGTSFATPIAAGTAAMILEHARVLESTRSKGRFDSLRRKEGMLAMFRAVTGARESDDRRYYLNPLEFYSQDDETRWSDIVWALKHS